MGCEFFCVGRTRVSCCCLAYLPSGAHTIHHRERKGAVLKRAGLGDEHLVYFGFWWDVAGVDGYRSRKGFEIRNMPPR